MEENVLLQKLKANKVALGYSNSFPHPGAVEFGCRGWDFIWICSQHGYYDYDSTYYSMLAAERHGVATVVRVPGHEPDYMSRIMDLAPAALMVPLVNNAEEARAIAKAVSFPPLGVRSYSGVRSLTLFGGDYHKEKRTLVIAQIETEQAVHNAREIINTPGIDMLFFSAADMRITMGIPLSIEVDQSPILTDYLRQVSQACLEAGKLAGTVAMSDSLLKLSVEAGYTVIATAGDSFFLRKSQPYALEVRGRTEEYLNAMNKG